MDRIQRTPITIEQRRATFSELARTPSIPVKANLLLLLQMTAALSPAFLAWTAIVRHLVGWGGWRYIIAIAAVIAALPLGFYFTIWLFGLFDRLEAYRTKKASDEKLWKRVAWGLENQTQVCTQLAQLAARGRDVSVVLPRLLELLDAESAVTRLVAFDTLRYVFPDEHRAIQTYNPERTHDCHAQVARLKELIRAENQSVMPGGGAVSRSSASTVVK
ncbi:MAG: hypothetical protein ABFC96_09825 [Thermoguttaceae bacterium]